MSASKALLSRGLGLVAVVLVALALAGMWAVRVPFFESPDENAHADYAFTLFTARAPVPLLGRTSATNVHPLVAYLESVSRFSDLHYNPDGRVGAGYGSAAFLRAVDAGAPAVPRDFLAHNGGRVPYVAGSYAPFYYVLDALAIGAGAALSGGAASAEFYAARGLNLLLLLGSLLLAFATFRELRIGYGRSLALTATIGFFPLTSWVSAYVQPDNLSFTAVTLVLYLAVRVRREAAGIGWWACLGLALGLLALTKAQYFVAVAVPVLAALALSLATARGAWSGRAARAALVVLPALLAGLSVRASAAGADRHLVGSAAGEGSPLAEAAKQGLVPLAHAVAALIAKMFFATFYDGRAFYGYWGGFSWDDTQIGFGPAVVTRLVYALVGACSLVLALLVTVRLGAGVWPRLARVARLRGRLCAARLLVRDVHLNSYLCFIALMLVLYVLTGGAQASAGRYWLPLIVCSLLCATRVAPRALPRRYARRFAPAIAAAALLFSVAGALASPAAIEARFYVPPQHPLTVEADALIRRINGLRVSALAGKAPPAFSSWETLQVEGVALDSHHSQPVEYVELAVDGVPAARAAYGLPEPKVAGEMHEDRFLATGYAARLDLRAFPPGLHELSLLVGEPGRAAPWPSAVRVPFTIEARPVGAQAGRNLRAPR